MRCNTDNTKAGVLVRIPLHLRVPPESVDAQNTHDYLSPNHLQVSMLKTLFGHYEDIARMLASAMLRGRGEHGVGGWKQ